MTLLTTELFYQSSLKNYLALMPYITHPETRDITLNPAGMLWVNYHRESFTYVSVALREQISILVDEVLRAHSDGTPVATRNVSQKSLFLKRKTAGVLRLNDENHHLFYTEGVLDLGVTGLNEGTLYVNILSDKMYIHYIEFSYHIGVFN